MLWLQILYSSCITFILKIVVFACTVCIYCNVYNITAIIAIIAYGIKSKLSPESESAYFYTLESESESIPATRRTTGIRIGISSVCLKAESESIPVGRNQAQAMLFGRCCRFGGKWGDQRAFLLFWRDASQYGRGAYR